MSILKFMLSSVEHENSGITLGFVYWACDLVRPKSLYRPKPMYPATVLHVEEIKFLLWIVLNSSTEPANNNEAD